jgi:hypothetical protein
VLVTLYDPAPVGDPPIGFPAFWVPALLVTHYISLLFFFAGVEYREKRSKQKPWWRCVG